MLRKKKKLKDYGQHVHVRNKNQTCKEKTIKFFFDSNKCKIKK